MQARAVLFLSSNPPSGERLDIHAEYREVRQAIARWPAWADQIELLPEWSLDDDLLGEIQGRRAQVLHFAGHGDREGGIVLHPARGAPLRTDALSTAEYLRRIAAPHVPLVVLNLCHSALLAERLVLSGPAPPEPSGEAPAPAARPKAAGVDREMSIPDVGREPAPALPALATDVPASIDMAIGMDGTIGDEAAIELSAALYAALAAGKSVADAFGIANARVQAEHPGRASPRLFHRPGVDPGKVFILPAGSGGRPWVFSVALTTLACVLFFVGVEVFYAVWEPDPWENPAPGPGYVAAVSATLWLVLTSSALLVRLYRSTRRGQSRGKVVRG